MILYTEPRAPSNRHHSPLHTRAQCPEEMTASSVIMAASSRRTEGYVTWMVSEQLTNRYCHTITGGVSIIPGEGPGHHSAIQSEMSMEIATSSGISPPFGLLSRSYDMKGIFAELTERHEHPDK